MRWWKAHPEKAQWLKAHPEIGRARNRRWVAANPSRVRELRNEWRRRNPEKYWLSYVRGRFGGSLPPEEILEMLKEVRLWRRAMGDGRMSQTGEW